MTKKYFTPVDFEKVFPTSLAEPEAPVPDPSFAIKRSIDIAVVTANINTELQAIRTGHSKLVPTAQQFNESKTPFCIALTQFSDNEGLLQALRLVALAKQDFGDRFANFVLREFQGIYESRNDKK